LYLKADTAFDHTSFVEERYAVIVSSLCDANFFRDAEPMFGLSVDAHDSSFDTEGGSQALMRELIPRWQLRGHGAMIF
jgi:hypothetical protein